MSGSPYGAALTIVRERFGFEILELDSAPTIQTTITNVVGNNADRVGLVVFNAGANDVFIYINTNVSTTLGIKLVAGAGFMTLNVNDDLTLPSRAWFAVANLAPVVLTVIEYIGIAKLPLGGK